MHFRVCAFRRVHDFLRTLIKNQMIVRLHADSNYFVCLRHRGTLALRYVRLQLLKTFPFVIHLGYVATTGDDTH